MTLKLAWASFTRPQQWWKLLQGPTWQSNRRAQLSHDLHYIKTCFQGHSWHKNIRTRASQDLQNGEKCLRNDTRTGLYELHRTSTVLKTAFKIYPNPQTGVHELHSTSKVVKKRFFGPFWNSNRHQQASQYRHCGENCFQLLSWHLKWRARVSQDHNSGKTWFLDLSWYSNWCARTLLDLHNGENCLLSPFDTQTGFTGLSQWWKMHLLNIFWYKLIGTSFTGPPQWWRFTRPPQWWKRLFRRVKPGSVFLACALRLRAHAACGFVVCVIITWLKWLGLAIF